MPEARLEALFGLETGAWLYRMARGIHTEAVQQRTLPKSLACGKTFRAQNVIRTLQDGRYWLLQIATVCPRGTRGAPATVPDTRGTAPGDPDVRRPPDTFDFPHFPIRMPDTQFCQGNSWEGLRPSEKWGKWEWGTSVSRCVFLPFFLHYPRRPRFSPFSCHL